MSDVDYRTKLTTKIVNINPNVPNREQSRLKNRNRVRGNSVQTTHPRIKGSYGKIVENNKIRGMLKQTKHSKILTNKVKKHFNI